MKHPPARQLHLAAAVTGSMMISSLMVMATIVAVNAGPKAGAIAFAIMAAALLLLEMMMWKLSGQDWADD